MFYHIECYLILSLLIEGLKGTFMLILTRCVRKKNHKNSHNNHRHLVIDFVDSNHHHKYNYWTYSVLHKVIYI